MEDLGIDAESLPMIAAVEREPKGDQGYTVKWLFDLVAKEYPNAKLIVCEGLATFVPGGKINDYAAVSKFLRQLTRECKARKMTFIGVLHATKTKEGEGFNSPREKILGSVAWGAFAETIFYIEPFSSKDVENPYRRFRLLPRNHAGDQTFTYTLDRNTGGRLVLLGKGEAAPASHRGRQKADPFGRYLERLEANGVKSFTTKEAQEALSSEMSERAVHTKLKESVGDGTLEKSANGINTDVRQAVTDLLHPNG